MDVEKERELFEAVFRERYSGRLTFSRTLNNARYESFETEWALIGWLAAKRDAQHNEGEG